MRFSNILDEHACEIIDFEINQFLKERERKKIENACEYMYRLLFLKFQHAIVLFIINMWFAAYIAICTKGRSDVLR